MFGFKKKEKKEEFNFPAVTLAEIAGTYKSPESRWNSKAPRETLTIEGDNFIEISEDTVADGTVSVIKESGKVTVEGCRVYRQTFQSDENGEDISELMKDEKPIFCGYYVDGEIIDEEGPAREKDGVLDIEYKKTKYLHTTYQLANGKVRRECVTKAGLNPGTQILEGTYEEDGNRLTLEFPEMTEILVKYQNIYFSVYYQKVEWHRFRQALES